MTKEEILNAIQELVNLRNKEEEILKQIAAASVWGGHAIDFITMDDRGSFTVWYNDDVMDASEVDRKQFENFIQPKPECHQRIDDKMRYLSDAMTGTHLVQIRNLYYANYEHDHVLGEWTDFDSRRFDLANIDLYEFRYKWNGL